MRFRGGVVNAFQNLLTELDDWCPSLIWLDFEKIGREDVVRLEKAFSVEKVFSILPKLNRNKALGLNDFYAAFW